MRNQYKGRIKLLFFAISPWIVGRFMEYLIMELGWYGMELSIISIVFCIYWFFVGYKSYDYGKSKKESILLGNSLATICFLLVFLQGIILGRYMFNFIGHFPQTFFMPMTRVSSWVYRIPTLFIRRMTMYSTVYEIISYILMIGIYYLGYSVSNTLEEGPVQNYKINK